MNTNLVTRSLKKVLSSWSRARRAHKPLDAKGLARIHEQLQDCASGLGGEVSARQRAAKLGETYLGLDEEGRYAVLRLIATGFGPDPVKIAEAHANYQASLNTPAQWEAEAQLWRALRSPRARILRQFNALPQGVRFLVDLRVDLMHALKRDPELMALDRELEYVFSHWFDVGFLELQRITWNSPAALLEKLIRYEAVHTIHSWTDLKNRLDSDRRCYGFFHPRMPDEPLIFVEVALTDHLAGNVQALLDEHAPVFDTDAADTAIFYSISNTQTGLRGVSFGNFLLKRVIEDLKRDFPKLACFSTLSPLPTLARWTETHPDVWTRVFSPDEIERILKAAGAADAAQLPDALRLLLAQPDHMDSRLSRLVQSALTRLAAHYLLSARQAHKNLPYDPVARFHLGNGARVERLNYLADVSEKGLKQSFGMMVNYLYDPEAIESNVEALLKSGTIVASGNVRQSARTVARQDT